MKREIVETFLGKPVTVFLMDGDVYEGTLQKTGTELFRHDPNLYVPKNYYFLAEGVKCKSALFKCSHIRHIAWKS